MYLVQVAAIPPPPDSSTSDGQLQTSRERAGLLGLGDVPDLPAVLEAISHTASAREYASYSHDLDDRVVATVLAARTPTFGQGGPGPLPCAEKRGAQDDGGEDLPPAAPAPSVLTQRSSSSSSSASLARQGQGQDPSGHGTPGSNAGPAPPSAGTVSKKAPRKWDQSILSTVCRWRACLCEADMSENGPMSGGVGAGKSANSNPNARYLCRYHAEVCRFLDDRYLDEVRARGGAKAKADVASESESAKYLPRKTPPPSLGDLGALPDNKRDLRIVRATSSLLNELWDGKLKATLRTFSKKVILDMGLRRRMDQFAANLFSRLSAKEQKLLLGVADGSIVLPRGGEELTVGLPSKQSQISVDNMDRKSATAVAKEAKIKRLEYIHSVKEAKALVGSLGDDMETLLLAGVATGPPPVPSWAIWKNEENLSRVLTSQTTVQAALEGIFKAESAITQELSKLAELRVFPGNELAIIKKEVKAHRAAHTPMIDKLAKLEAARAKRERASKATGDGDGDGSGLDDNTATAVLHLRHAEDYVAMVGAEYKLCERKLSILRAKRMDEAAALAQQERKLQKRRQRQEEQQRDPANFGFR